MKAREINDTIRYTMWSVFRRPNRPEGDPSRLAADALADIEKAADGEDLAIRGWYDVAGLRADADLMVWWHAPDIQVLQDAYLAFRRSTLGDQLESVWSQAALHRPAEFNKGHVPAFMSGEDPKSYVCVYPFVRSYEWYLLPDEERRTMLAEHGMMARPFADVRANTVASFALGDYEWMLAFESDELHQIVDLMRELRKAEARRHTREETPFYTGRRRELADIVATW
ncbi:MAG TPA: hydrogen peroxide-dependent heme synthase [Microlunatus sp.]